MDHSPSHYLSWTRFPNQDFLKELPHGTQPYSSRPTRYPPHISWTKTWNVHDPYPILTFPTSWRCYTRTITVKTIFWTSSLQVRVSSWDTSEIKNFETLKPWNHHKRRKARLYWLSISRFPRPLWRLHSSPFTITIWTLWIILFSISAIFNPTRTFPSANSSITKSPRLPLAMCSRMFSFRKNIQESERP